MQTKSGAVQKTPGLSGGTAGYAKQNTQKSSLQRRTWSRNGTQCHPDQSNCSTVGLKCRWNWALSRWNSWIKLWYSTRRALIWFISHSQLLSLCVAWGLWYKIVTSTSFLWSISVCLREWLSNMNSEWMWVSADGEKAGESEKWNVVFTPTPSHAAATPDPVWIRPDHCFFFIWPFIYFYCTWELLLRLRQSYSSKFDLDEIT